MTAALSAGDSALLLRQLAALREGGTPAGRALTLASAGLPEGPLREALSQLARALERGEPPPTAQPDSLPALLARGDGAPSAALRRAAHARALEQEVGRAWRSGALYPAFLLLLGGLGGAAFGAAMQEWIFPGFNLSSRLSLRMGTALRWVGPFAALLGAALLVVRPRGFGPGVRRLRRARRLLLLAGEPAATASQDAEPIATVSGAVPLEPRERAALAVLLRRHPLPEALFRLAGALEQDARGEVDAFRLWFPPVAVALVLFVGSTLVLGMFITVFSIAGAID